METLAAYETPRHWPPSHPRKAIHFHRELWLPQPRETIFSFFADAHNLQTLTPDWLHFEILTPPPIAMQSGALIDYRLRIHGIPVRWQTEITSWSPPYYFSDQQRRGPYHYWHHLHRFINQNGGTRCIDEVIYWPMGGRLCNALFVRRDVEKIFTYRQSKLETLFRPT